MRSGLRKIAVDTILKAVALAAMAAWMVSCRPGAKYDRLIIRASERDGGAVLATVNQPQAVRALHAILLSAPPLASAHADDGPLRRMEFSTAFGRLDPYDFSPYWPGSTMLVFHHGNPAYSTPIVNVQTWCRTAGVPFDQVFQSWKK